MSIGQSDAGNEPESSTIRQAYDLIAAGFGDGANGPLTVAVDLDQVGGENGLPHLAQDISRPPTSPRSGRR